MPEYSRPLGDAVKYARKHQGLTKKQLADKINVDERTITSIETYQANTTMAVLYPLLRTLNAVTGKQSFPVTAWFLVSHLCKIISGNCIRCVVTWRGAKVQKTDSKEVTAW